MSTNPTRSTWLRLRGVVIHHDPAKSRRPTGAIYSAAWPRRRKATRDDIEAALFFRRTIREDRPGYVVGFDRFEDVDRPASLDRAPFDYVAGLPGSAFIRHPDDGRLILVRRGVLGFWPCHYLPAAGRTLEDLAAALNGGPLAPEVEAAMLAGSMFGWDVPAADPARYEPGTDRLRPRRAIGEAPAAYVLEPARALRVASRTFHTTPAFPRTLRGPRGGQAIAPTPCSDCVAFQTCRPGACSAPFGCDSWVDLDGRRVDVDADNARLLAAIAAREAEAGRIPEGLAPEDWADMTPTERETAEGIDALTRLPDLAEDAAALELEEAGPADLGPLFAVKSPSCYYGDPYWLTTRYPGRCRKCGRPVHRGERAFYFPKGKALYCADGCGPEASARFNAERADEDLYNGFGGGWA